MAVAFIVAGAEGSAASDNITLGTPDVSGQVNDYIWLAVIHTSDQNNMTMDAAWTEIFQQNGTGSTNSRLAVFYHRYAGSVPSMVVTHSAGQSPIGGVAVFSGCITIGSPVDAISAITRSFAPHI